MNYNPKKVAVLASNSFTGSHFVNYLLQNTDVEVVGVSRSEEYESIFLPYKYNKPSSSRFKFNRLDVNKDLESILDLLDEEKPDTIVNYSAQGEVRNSWRNPLQWFQTNCMAVVALSDALKDKSYLKRYVAISTPEVYGSTEEDLKENHNYNPSTPYAASKLAGDLFLETLHKKTNFPVIFTRSANVYGIHQQLFRIIPKTLINLNSGKKIELHGEGKTQRGFIHVRDVADATYKAIQRGNLGESYHLASESPISIYSLVKSICNMTGKNFKNSVVLKKENFGQDALYSLDSSKARQELGWTPKINLNTGIAEVIEWINKNWEVIKSLPSDYIHKE